MPGGKEEWSGEEWRRVDPELNWNQAKKCLLRLKRNVYKARNNGVKGGWRSRDLRGGENAGKEGRQDGCGFKAENRHGCYNRVGYRTRVT